MHKSCTSHKPSRIFLPGTQLYCLCGLWLCLSCFKQDQELLDRGCAHALNNSSWLMTNCSFACSTLLACTGTRLEDGGRIIPSGEPDRGSLLQVSQLMIHAHSLGPSSKSSPVLPHWNLISHNVYIMHGIMTDAISQSRLLINTSYRSIT